MRDEKRFDEFLYWFKKLWETVPDLRFPQVYTVMAIQAKDKFDRDLYYMEEDEQIELIKDILENGEFVK